MNNIPDNIKQHYSSSLKEVEKKQTTFNNDITDTTRCVYVYNKKYCVIF